MLTRCTSGMVIVTNRAFLRTPAAQNTLLGKLARHWESHHGLTKTWTDWKLVAEQKADMPGAPGLRQLSPLAPIIRTARQEMPISRMQLAELSTLPCQNRIDEEPLQSIFPNLNVGAPSNAKPTHGCWDNSSGLNTVKLVGATGSPGHRTGRWPTSRLASQAHLTSQDPFPSLTGLTHVKNVTNRLGQWNQVAKSRW